MTFQTNFSDEMVHLDLIDCINVDKNGKFLDETFSSDTEWKNNSLLMFQRAQNSFSE